MDILGSIRQGGTTEVSEAFRVPSGLPRHADTTGGERHTDLLVAGDQTPPTAGIFGCGFCHCETLACRWIDLPSWHARVARRRAGPLDRPVASAGTLPATADHRRCAVFGPGKRARPVLDLILECPETGGKRYPLGVLRALTASTRLPSCRAILIAQA